MKALYVVIAVFAPASAFGQQGPTNPGPPAAFRFDTSGNRSVNASINALNAPTDACYSEMKSTVVNLGVTNATCHVVYVPHLPRLFGSRNALQVNATASHVRNGSGQGLGKLNASGALQTCRVVTSGSACWGATVVSEDTAGAAGALVGIEVDVNIQNPRAAYVGPAANPAGVRAVLVGSHEGSVGTAFTAQKLGRGLGAARWATGFLTADSGAATGLSLGALGTSANQGGQPIVLHYRNRDDEDRTAQINVDAAGNLLLRAGDDAKGATIVQSPVVVTGGRVEDVAVALDCGANANVAIDARAGNYFTCSITSNVGVVIQAPTNNPSGRTMSQVMTIAIRNASGAPLRTAPTFSPSVGGFRLSPVANPTSDTQVLYTFRWDPTQSLWYEVVPHQTVGF